MAHGKCLEWRIDMNKINAYKMMTSEMLEALKNKRNLLKMHFQQMLLMKNA
ncbi:hypothetical protein ACI2OX_21455 [Bacillus sp. N9]